MILRRVIAELRAMPKFIYVLAAIAAFGIGVGLYRMAVGLGPTTNLTDESPWGIWISFDLATVALSGGAFTLAALVYVFQFDSLHAAVRPTVLAGLLGYSSVLVILLFDLGRWDRFYNVFLHPNFSSALLEVSWCIAAYSTILIYEFSPVLLQNSRLKWLLPTIKKYLIPLVIVGVTLSTMHQSSLGTLFVIMSPRVHPLWYSMLLPVFFLVSSLAAGISMVLAGATVSYWLFGRSLKIKTLSQLSWFLPWILGFYLVLKFGELIIANELDLLTEGGRYTALFWTELIIGAAIPIMLFAMKQVRTSRAASLFGASLVLGGVILNRFDVTWFGMKASGASYTPHWMEVALLVGVLSGVVLVYSLIARYFPVYEETYAVERAAKAAPAPALDGARPAEA
ncbi:MAG TPA: polysulfide reductase NrfD [Aggregatilinea sp.]|uniref:NrfD/PsrC family molybdoenzyme membrane anchor subunit n=1 Tax=Aggregatilinea sp. TaxID=2806333 RepID=UPI002C6F1335|nr:NrfD/PsrC family molybdoenzyme membrane anchor subunit [Aggregatilinea sp.]HML21956.1 polysulfide reductase NrfD [Aggregatilinea sp.]